MFEPFTASQIENESLFNQQFQTGIWNLKKLVCYKFKMKSTTKMEGPFVQADFFVINKNISTSVKCLFMICNTSMRLSTLYHGPNQLLGP